MKDFYLTARRFGFFFGISLLGVHVLCAQATYDSTPPSVPSGVAASVNAQSPFQVTVTWQASTDNLSVTRYNVYRNGSFYLTPSSLATTFIDTNVTEGVTYTYSIQAGDGDGNNSAQSQSVEITVAPLAVGKNITPQPERTDLSLSQTITSVTSIYTNTAQEVNDPTKQSPTYVVSRATDKSITITWHNPLATSTKSVRVIKKKTSLPVSSSDGVIICDTKNQECIDKDVSPGTTYYYGVYGVSNDYLPSHLVPVSQITRSAQVSAATTEYTSSAQIVSTKAQLTKTLKEGSTGEEVRMLQRFLNTYGYTVAVTGPGSYGSETTLFGKGTTKALKAYQCARKIVCSGTVESTGYGMVGKTTRAFINKEMK
jgi:hypothetical protein